MNCQLEATKNPLGLHCSLLFPWLYVAEWAVCSFKIICHFAFSLFKRCHCSLLHVEGTNIKAIQLYFQRTSPLWKTVNQGPPAYRQGMNKRIARSLCVIAFVSESVSVYECSGWV